MSVSIGHFAIMFMSSLTKEASRIEKRLDPCTNFVAPNGHPCRRKGRPARADVRGRTSNDDECNRQMNAGENVSSAGERRQQTGKRCRDFGAVPRGSLFCAPAESQVIDWSPLLPWTMIVSVSDDRSPCRNGRNGGIRGGSTSSFGCRVMVPSSRVPPIEKCFRGLMELLAVVESV